MPQSSASKALFHFLTRIVKTALVTALTLFFLADYATAADPLVVPPSNGQLVYYGTPDGYLCYYNGNPVGSNQYAVAVASVQMPGWDPYVGTSPQGAFYRGSGVYDGKSYSYYATHQVWPYKIINVITQYVCEPGTASSPANNCGGMLHSRNKPAECCPCGYDYDSASSSCKLNTLARKTCVPETYALTLTVPAGDIEPTGTAAVGNITSKVMSVSVINQPTGLPRSGVKVRIILGVSPGTGGHDHDDILRPRGTLSGCTAVTNLPGNYDCTTGTDGKAAFTFTATPVSGTHTLSTICLSPTCVNSAAAVQDVKVAGLATIPASPFYAFVGETALHSDNHYLTPQAEAILNRIAVTYQFESRFKIFGADPSIPINDQRPLTLNDASLVWGGLFDYTGSWHSPHVEHRRGTVVDIRANQAAGAVPKDLFDEFEKMIQEYKKHLNQPIDFMLECTQDKKDKPGVPPTPKHNRTPDNFCVSQLDGSEDTNRHYHIRLMGVKE